MNLNQDRPCLKLNYGSLCSAMDAVMKQGVDRLFLVEDEYGLIQLEAEVAWVQRLIREIRDGTLTETRDGTLVWKVTNPTLALMGIGEEVKQGDTELFL